LKGETEAKQNS